MRSGQATAAPTAVGNPAPIDPPIVTNQSWPRAVASGPATGALLMGISAERFGLRIPLGVGALILLILLAPAFRRLPQLADILEAKFRDPPEP